MSLPHNLGGYDAFKLTLYRSLEMCGQRQGQFDASSDMYPLSGYSCPFRRSPPVDPPGDHVEESRKILPNQPSLASVTKRSSPQVHTIAFPLPHRRLPKPLPLGVLPRGPGDSRSVLDSCIAAEPMRRCSDPAITSTSSLLFASPKRPSLPLACEEYLVSSSPAQANKKPRLRIWEDYFESLCAFKRMHGHCDVPMDFSSDIGLGGWVSAQRIIKADLPDERRRRLTELGFNWWIPPTKEKVKYDLPQLQKEERTEKQDETQLNNLKCARPRTFEESFQALIRFKEEHGHVVVPQKCEEDPRLGRWVKNLRQKQDKLTEEQRARLDSVGFRWKLKRNSSILMDQTTNAEESSDGEE